MCWDCNNLTASHLASILCSDGGYLPSLSLVGIRHRSGVLYHIYRGRDTQTAVDDDQPSWAVLAGGPAQKPASSTHTKNSMCSPCKFHRSVSRGCAEEARFE